MDEDRLFELDKCQIEERLVRLRYLAQSNDRRVAVFLFGELMQTCRHLAAKWGFEIKAHRSAM